jgi:hypothetical protein
MECLIVLFALIGICFILSKLSKGFTHLGNLLEAVGKTLAEHDYKKNYPHPEDTESKKKTLRRARKEVLDAEYKKRVNKEIDELTKGHVL